MESDQAVLTPIPTRQVPQGKRPSPIRLFSLLLLITTLYGIWEWYGHYTRIAKDRPFSSLARNELIDILQYENGLGMEEIVLKYKFYLIPFAGYTEPNILLAICMVLTLPYVLNFIVNHLLMQQRESATPIAFFQLNLSSIYLQILRLGVDLAHYFVAGKCICLVSGAGAVWVHLLTKITCYNVHILLRQPLRLFLTLGTFGVALWMIFLKDRLDLLVSIAVALLDMAFLQGGTVKFPKEVFQEKEEWASKIRLDRSPLWESFRWNEFKPNQRLCVDSVQYYIPRQDRLIMNGL